MTTNEDAVTTNEKEFESEMTGRYRQFIDLVSAAEECLNRGKLEAAVGLAQMAAHRAFPRHIGIFTSPRLERLLLAIGRKLGTPPRVSLPQLGSRSRRVLHVLTYARPLGGDTRFAWRWIELDEESQHFVALTTQEEVKGLYDIPEPLAQAVAKSGGEIHVLSASRSTILEGSRELRQLAREMDVVVLHLFPHDIVPVLALAADCEAVRVALMNHSDHTFWIGGSVSDLVVCFREQPPNFLSRRRGLNPERSAVLPIPMAAAPRQLSRPDAKKALGYSPETVLLLTIASPFKYSLPGQQSFLDLVTPVLAEHANAVLVAVGPEAEGQWQEASAQTDGRIQALGTRWDTDVLYAAADIYLDSYPFSSVTSILEAGRLGVPILACDRAGLDLKLLGPGSPGLDGTIELASDVDAYQHALSRMISDEALRHSCGARVQKSILSTHSGKSWSRAANAVYSKLGDGREKCLLPTEDDAFDNNELDLFLDRLYCHVPVPNVRGEIQDYLGKIPYQSRFEVLRLLKKKSFSFHPLSWLPSWLYFALRKLARLTKKITPAPSPRS